jgi:hypothetical protein
MNFWSEILFLHAECNKNETYAISHTRTMRIITSEKQHSRRGDLEVF